MRQLLVHYKIPKLFLLCFFSSITCCLAAMEMSLHQAAANNRVDIIQQYIDARVNLNVRKNNLIGSTPLIIAATHGHLEALKLLLDNGALIDWTDRCQSTPLLAAAEFGQCACIQELVMRGANYLLKDDINRNALYYARTRDEETMRTLEESIVKIVLEGRSQAQSDEEWKVENAFLRMSAIYYMLTKYKAKNLPYALLSRQLGVRK